MSKSRKLPIIKDRPRNYNKAQAYWKRVRRRINNKLFIDKDDENLPNAKSIVNDYDYSDYRFDLRFCKTCDKQYIDKHKRK